MVEIEELLLGSIRSMYILKRQVHEEGLGWLLCCFPPDEFNRRIANQIDCVCLVGCFIGR